MAKRKTHEDFISRMCSINPNIKILGKYNAVNEQIECKCLICDNKWTTTPSYLLRGRGCSCNKNNKNKIKVGTKFGRWTVISDEFKMSDRLYCKCVCECGVEKSVCKSNLTTGKSRSCGCLTREKASIANTIDLTGQRFGKLAVVQKSKVSYPNVEEVVWHCKCDCGSYIDVRGYSLRSGNTKSCGCMVSRGEEVIKTWLNKNNFKYIQQYSFDDCTYKGKLRFDFAILDNQSKPDVLIEYDGKQHYIPYGFLKDDEDFNVLKKRDEIKDKYCADNNLKLLRIPYWEFENIEKFLSKELGLFS